MKSNIQILIFLALSFTVLTFFLVNPVQACPYDYEGKFVIFTIVNFGGKEPVEGVNVTAVPTYETRSENKLFAYFGIFPKINDDHINKTSSITNKEGESAVWMIDGMKYNMTFAKEGRIYGNFMLYPKDNEYTILISVW